MHFLCFSTPFQLMWCGIHLLVFWTFPISRNRSETAYWLTSNWSASCLCVCESSSPNNTCNSTSSNFFSRFYMFLVCNFEVTTFKTPKPSFIRSCVGACSPRASRSNRRDSAAVFFKWKQKINAVRECSLFGINFDVLNTTTQHYAHTFLIYHLTASDTYRRHNKVAQCQIFMAQTALLPHRLSEIRISYFYTL